MKKVLIKTNDNLDDLYKTTFSKINRKTNKLLIILLIISISLNLIFFFSHQYKDDNFVNNTNCIRNNLELKEKETNSFFNYNSKFEYYLINGRITAFINADHIYISFIPIFCASLLYSDKRNKTDIEIIIDLKKLPENIEKALDYLRTIYVHSKILIRYNMYRTFKKYAILNDKKVRKESVRWLIEPTIKNEYVFIGDIDIVYLIDNYYDNYLMDMFNRTSCYSNIVRLNSTRLSGVHFSKWYCLYPILLPKKTDLMMYNENLILIRLKHLGVNIDYQTRFRPIFGIHMSVNRDSVIDKKRNVTWEVDGKKLLWKKFTDSNIYKFIYPLLDEFVKQKIFLLEKYYKNHE